MTHWTQSGPGEQHGSTALIAVDEIIKDAAGAEVLKTKAELGEVGEGAHAFILKVRLPTTLCCFWETKGPIMMFNGVDCFSLFFQTLHSVLNCNCSACSTLARCGMSAYCLQ